MHNLNSLVSVCGWKQNSESECIVEKIILLNVYVNKSDENDLSCLWNAEFTIIMRNIRCHSNKKVQIIFLSMQSVIARLVKHGKCLFIVNIAMEYRSL